MDIALPVLGGLGLFLYGMNLMGTGLQKAAGEKLKKLIEILTNNRLMGVVVGALVTMVIQSSSATTVMVIGFVNAGLMTLYQAVGVIMGANIGTTITAQLIAFKLTDLAPLAVAIGVGVWIATSRKRAKNLAEIMIGFGILFIGMDMMGNGLKPLAGNPIFSNIMVSLKDPFLGILVGLGLTTILQSSSASIGLLQALASQGLIGLDIAFPILFGDNIGTTTTALISSVGTNKTAKRAAVIHFLFNLIGTIIFMTLLRKPIESIVLRVSPNDIQRQIANAHTLFNILNVAIQLPFARLLVKAAMKLVPGDVEEATEAGLKFLDLRIIETPSIALGQVTKEILRMGKIVEDNLVVAAKAFKNKDEKMTQEVFSQEKVINRLESDIVRYLVELSNAPLTDEQHTQVNILINVVNDIERVGDHADNIAELAQLGIDERLQFSEEAIEEFDNIFSKSLEVFKKTLEALRDVDFDKAREVLRLEEEIDSLEKEYRTTHIERLNKLLCQPNSGAIFLDLLSNLERVSDHSSNISLYVLDQLKD
ncbi:Na/Pi cotransporter family protein [Clostridium sp. Cult1]|jgi:phosphate:Na+ symporter|uniref:Na/Pi cotransporter family protein n=1 Tax=Clostridium sp. Cult1 TaxID=2079002 RepID=UPI001F241C47|nr:Na/Pi cotransporter family protein [Clostridium sp. Cult1]MCF6462522.1 sodium-dependent phosphate transporter [Clostridium sp. Cult1]